MKHIKSLKQLILHVLLVFILITTSACHTTQPNSKQTTNQRTDTSKEDPKVQEAFDAFLNDIFVSEVKQDSITLNYTLANPADYGITDAPITFGEYGIDAVKEGYALSENYLKRLNDFDYNALSKTQKQTYTILKEDLELDQSSKDIYLYGEALSPTIGLQAQLPVLLAEYNFYTKEDIKTYLKLLPDMERYFKQILAYEQEKSSAGLFMSDTTADKIIEQCEDFIKNPENNYLIEVFNDRMDAYEGLTDKERTDFKNENKNAIINHVVPAYKALMNGLKQLKGTGTNENGLCHYEKGKEYYKYLVAASTGSNKSIEDLEKALDTTITGCLLKMSVLAQSNPNLSNDFYDMKFSKTEPEEILSYLQETITNDFPALKEEVNCNIKEVHKSLQEHLSPAFYLTPALDKCDENNIYINKNDNYDKNTIFTTIAHEGYPGHLYQNVYFNQQKPQPIRALLNFSGYSEGWATYCEMYSYGISGLEKDLAEFCMKNMVATLCMYAKVDIGVNYKGWTLEDTKEYLKNFGVTDQNAMQEVHQAMVDEPANYLKYTIGYLEFMELREKAEKELGDKFNQKDFHQFLLDMGPCQFYVLSEYLDDWIAEQ